MPEKRVWYATFAQQILALPYTHSLLGLHILHVSQFSGAFWLHRRLSCLRWNRRFRRSIQSKGAENDVGRREYHRARSGWGKTHEYRCLGIAFAALCDAASW